MLFCRYSVPYAYFLAGIKYLRKLKLSFVTDHAPGDA